MTIGDRLTALLDARGVKQSALAAQYRERMAKRGREFAQDTIESHISRLKKSEAVAVRFFFSDLTDARDLLDLLGVPEEEQSAYVCDANALLSPEERPVRVVVDLSDMAQGRALIEVGDELADKIVLAIPERVALVLTESQKGYLLPRCTPEGRVQVEVVANAEQGWARTQKLAADGAIVVSGRPFEPLARWIAIEHSDRKFKLEPSDGIARCARGKPIDDTDESASHRRLDGLFGDVAASAPPQHLVATPCALRSLLAKLALGRPIMQRPPNHLDMATMNGEARTRAAWGKSLNTPALATKEEWAGALMVRAKDVGVAESTSGSATDLASHRARVARGGSTPRAVLVDGELHLINATDVLRTRMQGLYGVLFHEEAQRESGFQRIEKLVATTPWEAWLDDPYMEAAIARIDPDGKDRDELEFARASLLLHGKLNAPAAPCTSAWRTALTEILKSDPPPAGVRVPTRIVENNETTTILPVSEFARRNTQRSVELLGIPALVPPRIVRDTSILALTQAEDHPGYFSQERGKWCMARRFLLPRSSELKDFDSLFTLFDASPSRVGYSESNDRWWIENRAKHLLDLEWKQAPVVTHARFWREADETLAALWIALRRAAQHADATTLHDGTGMLEMGGGLVALIRVTHVRATEDKHVEADFWRWPQLNANYPVEAHPTVSIKQEIDTRVAQTNSYRTCMRAEVPKQLFLAQGTARVTITFKATPWETLGERAMRSEFGAVVAGVLHAEDDAEAAASYDDD